MRNSLIVLNGKTLKDMRDYTKFQMKEKFE